MTAWRLVPGAGEALAPLPGAANMAVDVALFESVQRGAPATLRFYLWQPACLSLGRNQRARDIYDRARACAAGVDVVRRPTGGLAVLHDAELTYAVIAPVAAVGRPRAAYARINGVLAAALRSLGVIDATVAPGGAGAAPASAEAPPPCFDRPAAGEIVAGGGKLVGSAQRVERGVILQHGSILLEGSQLRIRALERQAVAAGAGAPLAGMGVPVAGAAAAGAAGLRPGAEDGGVTLRALLGRVPDAAEVAAAVSAAFASTDGIALAPGTLDRRERSRARELELGFRSADWTWRR